MRRQVGAYRFPVKIWKNVPTTAADGQQVEDWKNIHFETRGTFEQVGAREFFKNHRLKNDVTAVVNVMSCAAARAINPKTMRIEVMGRTYEIGASYDVDEMQEEVEIHCTQRL